MRYERVKPLLFRLDPEQAHDLTLHLLQWLQRLRLTRLIAQPVPARPTRLLGIEFPNPVGLAAGLDKNGRCLEAFAALGFGFIEVGTVTPRPQTGNPKPRLFRLPPALAVINRMGFNNDGVEALVANVQRSRYRGVLGINIGKNKDTPLEQAAQDYLICLRKVYALASYVTVNISSPNTPGLRSLQQGDAFVQLLSELADERARASTAHGRYLPLLVKLSPDLSDDELPGIVTTLIAHGIDGVIATNTTLGRAGVSGLRHAEESGGLSGAPLRDRATQVVAQLAALGGERLPVIGVGGILGGADGRAMFAAGARLVQVYSGLIYRGPELVRELVEESR